MRSAPLFIAEGNVVITGEPYPCDVKKDKKKGWRVAEGCKEKKSHFTLLGWKFSKWVQQ